MTPPHHSTASPHGQTLVFGHRPQLLPGATLSLPDESIAFTERGQHRDRQMFESAFPVGPFFAQYRLASSAERRAACINDC
jgi:hypothetical protein